MKKNLSQGAEATITLSNNKVIKNRLLKKYRLKELDEKIRKSRTKREAKILEKAKSFGVNVPNLLFPHSSEDPFAIILEFIKGDKLSEKLNSYKKEKQSFVMQQLGKQVALLHKNDIIHGDLTTSNVILSNYKIFIIDFGLGFISKRLEDKAVDLHLIKQALEAKHFQNWEFLFKEFEKGYKKDFKESKKVLEQLKKVESRGRYKKGS